jgi:hypothetical protein
MVLLIFDLAADDIEKGLPSSRSTCKSGVLIIIGKPCPKKY